MDEPSNPVASRRIGVIVGILAAGIVIGVGGYFLWQRSVAETPPSQSSASQSLSSSESDTTTNPLYAGWQTYTNTAQKYQISYPKDWILRESKPSKNKVVSLYEPNLVDALTSEELKGGYPNSAPVFPTLRISSSDSVKEAIDSREVTYSNTATNLEQYLANEKAITEKGEALGEFVDYKPSTVGIYPGFFVTVSGDGGEQYMTEVDGRLYILGLRGVSDEEKDILDQIVATFRVTSLPKEITSSVDDWQQYTDDRAGFTIKFPLDLPVVSSGEKEKWVAAKNPESTGGAYFGPASSAQGGYVWGVDARFKATDLEKEIADQGNQWKDRKEERRNLTIDGTPAVLVTVTTEQVKDWISKIVYITHNNKLYEISNGAIDRLEFTDFYQSFQFTD